MTLRDDQRALAIGIMLFFAGIVIAALLYILLDPAMTAVEDMALNQTSNSNATSAVNERASVWDNILFVPLFLTGLFIIGRAVFEARGP